MPRGMFTQCFSVLLKEPTTLDAVQAVLADFPILGRYPAAEHWAMNGPTLALSFRPEVNGVVLVDVVDQPWPDEMGDPQNESPISAAWMTGQFGPSTSPGSLQRAMKQSWGWKEGRTLPAEHRGFVRVRCSYAVNAPEDAPLTPSDWDATTEMQFLTRIVDKLLTLPGALCYFNPNGETLRDHAGFRAQLEQADAEKTLPIELWTNVRLYPYDADWAMMDTVGNSQLNVRTETSTQNNLLDVEALYRTKQYEHGEVDHFLRDLTLYLHGRGNVIKDNDTIEGPGNVSWKATLADNALAMPPRPVIRIVPVDGVEPPAKPA